MGVADSSVIGRRRGAFSTLLRRPVLRASTGGIMATNSERKMLASTCLYSLYAWLYHLSASAAFNFYKQKWVIAMYRFLSHQFGDYTLGELDNTAFE